MRNRPVQKGARATRSKLPSRPAGRREKTPPLTISRPELLIDGNDREFRHLVHALFGFFACHESIRGGHAATIGLAGVEYTVLISVAHLAGCPMRLISKVRRRRPRSSSDFTLRTTSPHCGAPRPNSGSMTTSPRAIISAATAIRFSARCFDGPPRRAAHRSSPPGCCATAASCIHRPAARTTAVPIAPAASATSTIPCSPS